MRKTRHADISHRYCIPTYYNSDNLPSRCLCQFFVFKQSQEAEILKIFRDMLESESEGYAKVRIYIETDVCEEVVSQCRALVAKFQPDAEIEIRDKQTSQLMGFTIGYLKGLVHYHKNLWN